MISKTIKEDDMRKSVVIGLSLFAVLAAGLVVMSWLSTTADAYDTWTGCVSCHGDYRASPYTSKGGDRSSWGTSLHDGHRNTMLNGDCNTCHSATSKTRFPHINQPEEPDLRLLAARDVTTAMV